MNLYTYNRHLRCTVLPGAPEPVDLNADKAICFEAFRIRSRSVIALPAGNLESALVFNDAEAPQFLTDLASICGYTLTLRRK